MSIPSATWPGIAYAAAFSAMSLTAVCCSMRVDIASRLFSMTNTTGSLWTDAKFMASWKSPVLVEPSPPNANTMYGSLRSFSASARPTACGNSVPTSTERETMRSFGELNMLSIARPPEFGSVAFASTLRNSSSALKPSTNARPMSR